MLNQKDPEIIRADNIQVFLTCAAKGHDLFGSLLGATYSLSFPFLTDKVNSPRSANLFLVSCFCSYCIKIGVLPMRERKSGVRGR